MVKSASAWVCKSPACIRLLPSNSGPQVHHAHLRKGARLFLSSRVTGDEWGGEGRVWEDATELQQLSHVSKPIENGLTFMISDIPGILDSTVLCLWFVTSS